MTLLSFLRHSLRRFVRHLYWLHLRWRNRGKPAQQIFSAYWQRNHWRNAESCSGDGSTLAYTEALRAALPPLLVRHGIHSMLDLPCGDFHWFSHVALPSGVHYTGADIVKPMLTQLQAQYGGPGRSFTTLDALTADLPAVDLWMCRDLIFHLPTAAVWQVLDSFLRSRIGHLLITSHDAADAVNGDTFMGGFRLINLRLPPFALPEPDERLKDYIEGFPPRHLLLYRRDTLNAWKRQLT